MLKRNFELTDESLLEQLFLLPHLVAFEPYVKAFQYKVLNSLLHTNIKLHRIGFISGDLCSFCHQALEMLHHLISECRYAESFWKQFEAFYESLTDLPTNLTVKGIVIQKNALH